MDSRYYRMADEQSSFEYQEQYKQQERHLQVQQIHLQLNTSLLTIQQQLTQRFAALTAARDARIQALPRSARDNANNKGRRDIEKKWREGIDEAQVSAMVAQQTAHHWAARQQQVIMSGPTTIPSSGQSRLGHLAKLRKAGHLESPISHLASNGSPATPQLVLSEPEDDTSTLSGSVQSYRSRSPYSILAEDSTATIQNGITSPSAGYSKSTPLGSMPELNDFGYPSLPMTATFPEEKSWRKRLEESGVDDDQISGLGLGFAALGFDGKAESTDNDAYPDRPRRRALSSNTKSTSIHRRTRSAIVTSTPSRSSQAMTSSDCAPSSLQELGPTRQPRGPDSDPSKNFQARIRCERANDVLKMIGRRTKAA